MVTPEWKGTYPEDMYIYRPRLGRLEEIVVGELEDLDILISTILKLWIPFFLPYPRCLSSFYQNTQEVPFGLLKDSFG